MSDFRAAVLSRLEQLFRDGGDGNYLVMDGSDEAYVQVAAERGVAVARLEARGAPSAELERLGLSPGEINHGVDVQLDAPEARERVFRLVARLFDAMGVAPGVVEFELELGGRWRLANPRLRAAIESSAALDERFARLAEAQVQLLHRPGEGLAGVVRDDRGAAVFFTEDAALARYRVAHPAAPGGTVNDAASLLGWLGPGAVVFNPGGPAEWSLSAEGVAAFLARDPVQG